MSWNSGRKEQLPQVVLCIHDMACMYPHTYMYVYNK